MVKALVLNQSMNFEALGEKLVGPTVNNPDDYRDLGRSQLAGVAIGVDNIKQALRV